MWEELFTLIIGFIGGFTGGLLGVGGGVIYIPAMVLVLDEQQHMAQGASLAAIVATAIVAGTTHFRRGNVDLPTVAWVAPGAAAAGFGAAFLAAALDADTLRRMFAVVALYFGATMMYSAWREGRSPVAKEEPS